jgi:hypothetical protein
MEGYMLWAVATSAGAPILYGRFRPRSGEQPTGTYRFIATRLLRSQQQSNFCCGDIGLGLWRCPSHLPLGEAQAPQARGIHGLHRPAERSTVADAVIETHDGSPPRLHLQRKKRTEPSVMCRRWPTCAVSVCGESAARSGLAQ